MENLKDFITKILKNDTSIDYSSVKLNLDTLDGFDDFLTSCFVVKNEIHINLPNIVTSPSSRLSSPKKLDKPQDTEDGINYGLEHSAIIDHCILYLLEAKLFNNIITLGYSIARNDQVNSILHCNSINTNVNNIKRNPNWKRLHHLIDTTNFLNLLLNYSIFQWTTDDQPLTQIVGNRLNLPHKPPMWYQKQVDSLRSDKNPMIGNSSFLHKSATNYKPMHILPKDPPNRIYSVIFEAPSLASTNNKISKKLRHILCHHIAKMLSNHQQKIKYMRIYNKICPKTNTRNSKSHLDSQIKISEITRFLIIILEKLIPSELLGSKRNKSKLFKMVPMILSFPGNTTIEFGRYALKNFKVKDLAISLLKRSTITRDYFEVLTQVQHCFVLWTLTNLIPKILSTFFYCTEISSTTNVIYFRHDVWNELTAPFMSTYFEKYLVENISCRNHNSYTLSEFNHSKLRLIPKKASHEYRVIAVPCKGADHEENIIYKDNMRSVIAPVKSILEYIRNKIEHKNFKKLYCIQHIAKFVKNFKFSLLMKYGTLPELFLLKFDMASCYDSIPRNTAMDLIKKRMEEENGFFVRSQSFFNLKTQDLQVRNVVNGSSPFLNGTHSSSDLVFIDNVKTMHFSIDDVLKVLEMELFKTCLWIGSKCYLRKDGLFQGSSLSGLVVDIMYDDLLENYDEFKKRPGHDNLILRLADDFLIISTDKSQIIDIKDLAMTGFNKYNANVKAEKIVTVSSQSNHTDIIQFCALNIHVEKLEIWKDYTTFNVPLIRSRSQANMFYRLQSLFELRLSYRTTDLYLNSLKTVLKQVDYISRNMADVFLEAMKYELNVETKLFADFTTYLSKAIIHKACFGLRKKATNKLEAKIRSKILKAFFVTISKRQTKFQNIIKYLKSELKPFLSGDEIYHRQ
ncbi:telomerase reverse transcriptase NDAI_0J01750 [Naumovozyma dairenensis CBS 421]|uniref:Telomerase reverse transcriptase n=1 Tax=Naumovozyma dairenensis (strain ATCC 10597 / BCRC 20456 / CBS 421 / NBRC 0211 / NRRL Y-12639) TaxID=1071378 RepID=G0WGY9_NAUDC|nr:hypothetical protein NDAI_0J01750 [Naumovozyma dairenensis CBS 421]CCD27067.1 hypothetical protein NDAI_0J01750 [Naumovozyma dairenensis CBS 421]